MASAAMSDVSWENFSIAGSGRSPSAGGEQLPSHKKQHYTTGLKALAVSPPQQEKPPHHQKSNYSSGAVLSAATAGAVETIEMDPDEDLSKKPVVNSVQRLGTHGGVGSRRSSIASSINLSSGDDEDIPPPEEVRDASLALIKKTNTQDRLQSLSPHEGLSRRRASLGSNNSFSAAPDIIDGAAAEHQPDHQAKEETGQTRPFTANAYTSAAAPDSSLDDIVMEIPSLDQKEPTCNSNSIHDGNYEKLPRVSDRELEHSLNTFKFGEDRHEPADHAAAGVGAESNTSISTSEFMAATLSSATSAGAGSMNKPNKNNPPLAVVETPSESVEVATNLRAADADSAPDALSEAQSRLLSYQLRKKNQGETRAPPVNPIPGKKKAKEVSIQEGGFPAHDEERISSRYSTPASVPQMPEENPTKYGRGDEAYQQPAATARSTSMKSVGAMSTASSTRVDPHDKRGLLHEAAETLKAFTKHFEDPAELQRNYSAFRRHQLAGLERSRFETSKHGCRDASPNPDPPIGSDTESLLTGRTASPTFSELSKKSQYDLVQTVRKLQKQLEKRKRTTEDSQKEIGLMITQRKKEIGIINRLKEGLEREEMRREQVEMENTELKRELQTAKSSSDDQLHQLQQVSKEAIEAMAISLKSSLAEKEVLNQRIAELERQLASSLEEKKVSGISTASGSQSPKRRDVSGNRTPLGSPLTVKGSGKSLSSSATSRLGGGEEDVSKKALLLPSPQTCRSATASPKRGASESSPRPQSEITSNSSASGGKPLPSYMQPTASSARHTTAPSLTVPTQRVRKSPLTTSLSPPKLPTCTGEGNIDLSPPPITLDRAPALEAESHGKGGEKKDGLLAPASANKDGSGTAAPSPSDLSLTMQPPPEHNQASQATSSDCDSNKEEQAVQQNAISPFGGSLTTNSARLQQILNQDLVLDPLLHTVGTEGTASAMHSPGQRSLLDENDGECGDGANFALPSSTSTSSARLTNTLSTTNGSKKSLGVIGVATTSGLHPESSFASSAGGDIAQGGYSAITLKPPIAAAPRSGTSSPTAHSHEEQLLMKKADGTVLTKKSTYSSHGSLRQRIEAGTNSRHRSSSVKTK